MYRRTVDDQVLEFGHEGVLYRNSFVMYDRGTNSLWVHTTGECVKGELKGKQLEFLPSVVTRWRDWKKKYPNSEILEGKKVHGFMGTYSINKNQNHFGISVVSGEHATLYRIIDLEKQRVLHDQLEDQKILVFYDSEGQFATAWENKNDLQFHWDEDQKAFLDPTGQAWNMMLGAPLGGETTAKKLTSLPATAWLIHRWQGFYPKSRVFGATVKKAGTKKNKKK